MPTGSTPRLLALPLLLAACRAELSLPAAPAGAADEPPQIASFSPAAAHAGTLVTVRGRDLGRDGGTTRVQFGRGPFERAQSIAADATELTVAVPEGATSGAITLMTRGGTTTSEASFDYLGLGRVRGGAIGAQLDLREALCDARYHDGRYVAQPCGTNRLFQFNDHSASPGPVAIDVDAFASDATGTFVATASRAAAACPPDAGAALCRHLQTAPCACTPAEGPDALDLPVRGLAWHGSGRWLLGWTWRRLFVVDWEPETPEARTLHLSDATGCRLTAAWADGAQVVFACDGVLRRVDAEAGVADEQEVALADAGLTGPERSSAWDGLLALTDGSSVRVLDITQWPPAPVTIPGLLSNAPVKSLAFSPGSGRLFVAQEVSGGLDRVVTLDVRSEFPLPLAEHRLEAVESLAPAADGTMVVAMRGGLTLLHPDTVTPLGFVPFHLDLRSMHLRRGPGGATLEVLAGMTDAVRAYDLETLAERPPRARVAAEGDPLARIATVAAPDGSASYSLFITGTGVRATRDDTTDRFDAAFFAMSLGVSADGGTLLVHGTGGGASLAALDTADRAGWAGPPRAGLQPEGGVVRAFADRNTLFVAGTDRVGFLDLAAAKAGSLVAARAAVALPDAAADARPGPAGVWVRTAGGRLLLVRPDATEPRDCGPVPSGAVSDWALSPEGRHLWVLETLPAGGRLQGFALDPATCALGAVETTVFLPATRDLLVAPSGERLFLLSPSADRILVVQ